MNNSQTANQAETCPTCAALRERAEYVQRFDYRDGREAWKALADHKLNDHCLHIATPKEGGR